EFGERRFEIRHRDGPYISAVRVVQGHGPGRGVDTNQRHGVLNQRVTDLAPIPGCPGAHCRLPVTVDGDPDNGRVAAGDLNVEIVGVPALFGKGRPARPSRGHRDRRVIHTVAGAVVFEPVDVSDERRVRVAPAERVTEL